MYGFLKITPILLVATSLVFDPISTDADKFQEILENLRKCLPNDEPFNIPPLPVGEFIAWMGLDASYSGKLDFTNVKLSKCQPVKPKKPTKRPKADYEFVLPISVQADYDVNGIILEFLPIFGRGEMNVTLNIKTRGNISYEDNGNDIIFDLEVFNFITEAKPEIEVTGLQGNEHINNELQKPLQYVLETFFNETLKPVVAGIIKKETHINIEELTLEDLIKLGIGFVLGLSQSDRVLEVLDKCSIDDLINFIIEIWE